MKFLVDGYLVASFLRLKRSRSFIDCYICLSEEYYADCPSLCRQTNMGRSLSAKWVVDPTLLLSAEEWARLLDLPEPKDDGSVVCYWLSDSEEVLLRLFELARSGGRKIHLFSNIQSFRVRFYSPVAMLRHLKWRVRLMLSRRVRYCEAADPRQFLTALGASSAVVSDSFHALMFSTVFRKPVRIVVTPERVDMASRIDDVLARVGLRGIRVDAVSSNILSGWAGFPDDAVRRLDDWIAESRAFLEDALSRRSEPVS